MAVTFEVDLENKLARVVFEGRHTDRDFVDGYTHLRSCWLQYGPLDVIVDYTGVTEVVLTVQHVKEHTNKPSAVDTEHYIVAVAPQQEMYELGRMFATLTPETRPKLRVVRTMEEALVLVGAHSPSFQRKAI